MSAIWGIVALSPDVSVPEHSAQLFESTYQKNCKIDRYESASGADALFGCGIQYITKESEQEQLPFRHPERGLLFTADCLLDNRAELIDLLSSHGYDKKELTDAPDGTLMYYGYLIFGNDCVKHFRGLFSFAVWEEHTRTLTLFSDHTSNRCLYYIRQNGLLAFSTRTEPLLKLFPEVTPNVNYHKDFLLANASIIYVVPGETPYKEIFLMTPATRLTLTKDSASPFTYWTPGSAPSERCRSAAEYSRHFLALYNDCVRDALRTSGEVGISMSSGLDSTSVGVLAARELAKKDKFLHSYTFVPYYQKERRAGSKTIYDESGFVYELAKQYSNIRTTVLNNQGKNLFTDMKLCSNILEMPYKTAAFPNHYEICCDSASHGCKLLLSGTFGNHTVSFGYIQNILYDLYCKKRVVSFLSMINKYAKHERMSRKKMLFSSLKSFRSFRRHIRNPFARYIPENVFLSVTLLQNYNLRTRFSGNIYSLFSNGYVDHKTFRQQLSPQNFFVYAGVFETQFGLRTGMVLRDPTKDIRLIEFCYHLPYRMFAHGSIPRWLIRSSFSSLLPASILDSWGQHGILNTDWLQRVRRDWTSLKPEILQHLNTGLLDNYINKEQILFFIEAFEHSKKGDADMMTHLCALEGLLRFLLPDSASAT